MKHELKTIQPYFERCWEQSKTFEVRKNDRDFQKGDSVLLKEYDPVSNSYSGREIFGSILYVLPNFAGLAEGYCAFSFDIEITIVP